jgi:DNA-binding GntR family transcriptional regulator
MAAETAISRSVLSDAVKDRLLEAILDGRYPPGSRIVETRVARQFGTSQAPVREALRDLEALGVVEIAAFRGARVRRPSRDELLEAYVVRAELEALAVRLAMPRLTAADHHHLAGLLDQMLRAADAGDTVAEAAADAAFHGYLMERAGNLTLHRVWGRLEPYSRTYITLAVPGGDRRRMAALHAPVLDAIRTGDSALAEVAIREHFSTARNSLADRWAEPDPETESQPLPTTSRATRPRPHPVPDPARASERTG